MPERVAAAALILALAACSPEARAPSPAAAPQPTTQRAIPPEEEPHTHPPPLPAPVSLPSAPGEAGVREFVTAFLKARVEGNTPRARDFLSPTALEQYEKGENGLTLTGTAGQPFTGWDFVTVLAADASSWEITVRVRQDGSTFQETLFVGPGPDASETQRPWIVRGALRS
jgi:hypothetical protein